MSSYTGLSPDNPRRYTGANVFLSTVVTRKREPTGADYRQPETGSLYRTGSFWLVGPTPTTGSQGELWYLSKIVANVAFWLKFGTGSSGPLLMVDVDAATAPGVDPVTPDAGGTMIITGKQVASGSAGTEGVQTHSTALNQYQIRVQQSTTAASVDITKNGIAHFASAHFTNTTGFIDSKPATEQAVSAFANAGIASFNSTQFDVDGNGFVTLSSGGTAVTSFDVDTGANVVPTAGVVKVFGQDPPLTNGIETYNAAADEIGVRMKTPFIGDFQFLSASSGDTEILQVSNSSNTASSQSQLKLDVAGTTAGDAFATFEIPSGTSWAFGVDNSDSDNLKISRATALGTNDTTYWNSTGQVMPSGLGITYLTPSGTTGTPVTNQQKIFEEGSFVPTLVGGTIAGTTTYTNQEGYYIRIGNWVSIVADINITAQTGTGDAVFSAPFTGKTFAGGLVQATNDAIVQNVGTGVAHFYQNFISAGTTQIRLRDNDTATFYQVENASRYYSIAISYFI